MGFADKLASAMGSMSMGRGDDDGVKLGPLVNEATVDKVDGLVKDAISGGARALVGGQRPDGAGFFYPATVLVDVPEDADCLTEEIFGPVAPIVTFTTEAEAVRQANDTPFGLVAYLYTGDLGRGLRVSERLECGMVGINRGVISGPAAPFGGMKQSGIGREGAHDGLLEFLETQIRGFLALPERGLLGILHRWPERCRAPAGAWSTVRSSGRSALARPSKRPSNDFCRRASSA